MPDLVWKPNATVAALVVHAGRFLFVEESTDDGLRLNQPAGHIEYGESPEDACIRETLEETGFQVVPTALVGIYQWSPPGDDRRTYLRFAYVAEVDAAISPPLGATVWRDAAACGAGDVARPLDDGIVRALWLTPDEAMASRARHRSPLVLQCVQDYLAGRRFPLDVIHHG